VSAEETNIGNGRGRAKKEKAIYDVREGSRIEEIKTHVLEERGTIKKDWVMMKQNG
jgi:hypothetical protein